MAHPYEKQYFFSVQPFWPMQHKTVSLYNASGSIRASICAWDGVTSIHCVPGNAQVGIIMQGPEDFKGWCYGVLQEKGDVSLHGMRCAFFVQFSPGTFSKIMRQPTCEIDPNGVPIEDIFTPRQVAEIRDAVCQPYPLTALLLLFSSWEESAELFLSRHDYLIARDVSSQIWKEQGAIQLKELEHRVGYCGRYLRDVVNEQIGVTPKQLCRQTRFQSALRYLNHRPADSLASIALRFGYSDQAHMSREFKDFLGFSPSEYQNREYFEAQYG